jgi:hypothetical protein
LKGTGVQPLPLTGCTLRSPAAWKSVLGHLWGPCYIGSGQQRAHATAFSGPEQPPPFPSLGCGETGCHVAGCPLGLLSLGILHWHGTSWICGPLPPHAQAGQSQSRTAWTRVGDQHLWGRESSNPTPNGPFEEFSPTVENPCRIPPGKEHCSPGSVPFPLWRVPSGGPRVQPNPPSPSCLPSILRAASPSPSPGPTREVGS